MNLLSKNIKWIMLIAGLATSSVIAAAVAPTWTLNMMFGDSLVSPLSDIIVRNWGVLVGLIGLMLIYGAIDSSVRRPVLLVAVLSKIAFIVLIFMYGGQYLSKVAVSIAFDALVVIIFVLYLVGGRAAQDAN